nr:helix-turn-helix domain-containing protein [uncultured Acetatifactor sp.]
MKVFRFFRHSHTYRRMFLHTYAQYAAASLLVLLAAGLFLFYQDSHTVRNNTLQAAANLAYYADDRLSACQKLSANVGQSGRLLNLYSNSATDLDFSLLDSTMLFAAQHDLVSAKALNRFVATLGVYLYNKQYVVSDYGTLTLESFYQSIFNMSPSVFSEYLRPLGYGSFLFVPRGAVEETRTPQHPLVVLSVIDGNSTRYGNLFIFLDEKQLQEDIEQLLHNDDMEYYLFDGKGQLIVSNNNIEPENSSHILSRLETNDNYQSSIGKHSGWKGFAGYSEIYLEQRLHNRLRILAGICLFLLLLGLPLAHTICRRNYAPIRELAHIVSSPEENASGRDIEYEVLKSIITSIFQDKSLLEEQLLIYRPLLVNSMLLELLEGTQPKTEVLPGLKKLGIEFPFSSHVCCCVLTSCATQDFLVNLALAVRTENTGCLYVAFRKHFGIFLINGPSREVCENACGRLLELLAEVNPDALLGIGDVADSPEQLGSTCQQSRSALEYLPLDSLSRGVFWSQIRQSGILNLTLPACLVSLPVSFGTGQYTEARNSLNQYFQAVCRCGLVKKEHLLYAKEQLLAAMAKAEIGQNLHFNPAPLNAWTPEQPCALESLKELAALACDKLEQATQESREQQLQNSAQNLIDYLQLHLHDEDLSLSKLSNAFQLSESSISRRIKQITDYNFLDYVNRKRIEYACGLLAETDMSVNDISKAAGYENDITFRRLFKKYMGITPGDYRRQEGKA